MNGEQVNLTMRYMRTYNEMGNSRKKFMLFKYCEIAPCLGVDANWNFATTGY